MALTIDDLVKRAAAAAVFQLDYKVSDKIATLQANHPHRLADALCLLSGSRNYQDAFRETFLDKDGQPVVADGDQLATILGAVRDDRLRGLLALYTGEAILGIHGKEAIDRILTLGQTYAACIEDEALGKRIECIRDTPVFNAQMSIFEGKSVNLALELPSICLDLYKNLLNKINHNEPEIVGNNASLMICLLDEYKGLDIRGAIEYVTLVASIKNGLKTFSDPLAKALESGKETRIYYVFQMAEQMRMRDFTTQYLESLSQLVNHYIGLKDDEYVARIHNAVEKLIPLHFVNDELLADLVEMLKAQRHNCVMDDHEAKLASGIEGTINIIAHLHASGLLRNVYSAYKTVQGDLDVFFKQAVNPVIAHTFELLKNNDSGKIKILAEALATSDESLATKTAEMLYEFHFWKVPMEFYRGLQLQEPVDRIEGLRVIQSQNVKSVLASYLDKPAGVGVLLCVLYNNPDIANEWCKANHKHNITLSQMTNDQIKYAIRIFGLDEVNGEAHAMWPSDFTGRMNQLLRYCSTAK